MAKELGDYYNNSITKELGTNTARIDHAKDNDVYCFTPTITRYYTLSSTSGNSANINCIVYDAVGTHYKSDNKEAVKTESNERRSFYRMMFILDLFPDIDVELSTKIYNELSDDERKAQDCTRQYIGYKKINKDQTEALLKLKKDSKDTGIGYSWMPYAEFRILGCIEPLKKRITLNEVKSIVSQCDTFDETLVKIMEIQQVPDVIYTGNANCLINEFWLDEERSKYITVNGGYDVTEEMSGGQKMITYYENEKDNEGGYFIICG